MICTHYRDSRRSGPVPGGGRLEVGSLCASEFHVTALSFGGRGAAAAAAVQGDGGGLDGSFADIPDDGAGGADESDAP
jgi:hypothetical protein